MLELRKEMVTFRQVVPVTPLRTVVEHECIVPDALPDAARVLALDGAAVVENVTAGRDALSVSMSIRYTILYMADSGEGSIQSMQTQSSHTMSLEAPGLGEEASWDVFCCLEHLDHSLLNSRKMSFRAVVKCDARVENVVEQGVATEILGSGELECQREQVSISCRTEVLPATIEIRERLELPGGKASLYTLLRSDPRLCDLSMALSGDQLQIRGNLCLCTLYLADDALRSLQILENQVPINYSLPVPVLDDSIQWELSTNLQSCMVEPEEDGDGEKRILSLHAVVGLTVRGYETKQYDVLTDAYSLQQAITLQREPLTASRRLGEISVPFVLKEVLAKPENAPVMHEIVNVSGQIGQADYTAADGMVSVEGFVLCQVLYLSQDESQPIASFTQQIPYTQSWEQREVTDGVSVSLKPELSHISFSILSGEEMELRIALSVKGELTGTHCYSVVTQVEDCLEDPWEGIERPAILLYVVQPGDTLWKIGKKYRAPLSVLQEINDLENPDLIYPGQKLLIPT